jgi:hypothetical protein
MEAPPFAGGYEPRAGFFRAGVLKAGFSLFAGFLLPMFTIGFELVTRMCAETLFDPIPSLAHLALISAVPLLNLKLWIMRRREQPIGRGWIFAAAAATAVGFCYALLFLPVYPIAAIGIIFFGLGLLPFAPFAAGISALTFAIGGGRRSGQPFRKLVWTGIATGMVVTLALDVPTAITRYAVRASASSDTVERERAVRLMRGLGNRELLLRLCYDTSGYTGGLLGLIVDGSFSLRMDDFERRSLALGPDAARALYYRVTGDTHDSVPPPWNGGRWGFARGFDWDPDQGGTQVGGRVAGLALRGSRIDASMDADDAAAYVEWTAEFSNAEQWTPREARLSLALPPGGAVTRATLWVNGEEREAVFASRGDVRRAYERVVRTRRDPLLVTTSGADQALVQVFPVPALGSAKLRIGMTVPLALSADNRATLALPAIVDRNFSIGDGLRHAVWVEGDGREAISDPGFAPVAGPGNVMRSRANYTDRELSRRRPRVSLSRNPAAESVVSGGVIQTIRREPREPPGSFYVLLDGSKRAAPARAGLIAALDRIPTGARVGFGIASATPVSLPLAPWNADRRAALIELLAAQPFDGGEDNLGLLAEAFGSLEGEPRATLLWVHGPQGHSFGDHAAELEQVLERGRRLPELWLLPVEPGPNRLLRDPRLFVGAHTLAWSGDVRIDIGAAFDDYFDTAPRWTIARTEVRTQDGAAGLVTGSAHVEKLWALDEITALLDGTPADHERAVALAARYRIVTPVSGAVVLETDQDYVNAGLTPPDAGSVPTIPEPETWALFIVACLAFAWAAHRRRALA